MGWLAAMRVRVRLCSSKRGCPPQAGLTQVLGPSGEQGRAGQVGHTIQLRSKYAEEPGQGWRGRWGSRPHAEQGTGSGEKDKA
jgi:hypothetical protein